MNLIPRRFFFDDGDDFLSDFMPAVRTDNAMKCDVYEKGDKSFIEMDVPGFDKKDINIDFENGYLNITAHKESHNEDKDKKYVRKERSYSKVTRSFYIGDIEESNIKAEFKDGVLTVSVPKEEKVEAKKKIEIE